jgi:molybdopterin-containing oxidoreductase family iron-sulfur binding subunit
VAKKEEALARTPGDADRRAFLGRFAGGVFAAILAPGALRAGGVAKAQAAPAPAPAGTLEEIPPLPPAVSGESPVVRMMEDLRRALAKRVEQRRWGMVIDLRKCVGCNGCNIACVTENKLPPGMTYRPVMTETRGKYPNVARVFTPRPCMQCENPPCVPVCPVKATFVRPDGIVAMNYDQCIGCRYCLTACPYTARSSDAGYFYGDFEGGEKYAYEKLPSPEYHENRVRADGGSPIGNARKCHFCIHRIERGLLPACVLTCMGRATYFGDLNDSGSLVSELIGQPNVTTLRSELGTKPKVYYLT